MTTNDNLRGAGLMALSMAAYVLNDTCVKAVGGTVPVYQVIFLRGIVTVVLMALAARWFGVLRFDLSRRDWVIVLWRSLADTGATFLFISALMQMPLANVTAIMQALPLTVALAAALFLREPLGWRRMVAIGLGFAGVMLIVRPGPDGFSAWSLMALGAVACVTLRDVISRRLSPDTPSLTASLVNAAMIMVASGAAALVAGEWVPMTAASGGLIMAASVFIIVGYVSSVAVMRVGEIGFISPFRYTGLVWALILGVLVFGQFPDPLTLLGAAIVVATGVFTLWREQRLRRAEG